VFWAKGEFVNNFLMRKIVVSDTYQPLSTKKNEVATVEISCPPSNRALVFFKGDDGSDVPWCSGEFHQLTRVNLAEIYVKGTAGDVVTVVGGDW
jgi:hypothetical protein